MPFPLETPRLLLRHFREQDLDAFVAYRNDPEVYKYQGWTVPYVLQAGIEFIESMKNAIPGTEGQWFQSAIELKDSHAMIGDMAFFPKKDAHGQAYLGFTLARPFWGMGYAFEASKALINYMFGELHLHRIHADCDSENRASYGLLERLGFRREAHHVQSYWLGERWGDEYVYALLESEWQAG